MADANREMYTDSRYHAYKEAENHMAHFVGHYENELGHAMNRWVGPSIAEGAATTAWHQYHKMGHLLPIGYGSTHLGSADFVGATFFVACNLMLCFAVFFFMEAGNVPTKWRTSLTCSGLVQLIAFYNYTFMKDTWVYTQASPTVYRYTDWLITVPLLMAEFYLILRACGANTDGVFERLMVGTLVMLLSGWFGETQILGKLAGFVFGMAGWFYMVREITTGAGGQQAAKLSSGAARQAFQACKDIVVYGWIIYPIGYAVAYIIPGLPQGNYVEEMSLNVLYNLADLINKAGFGMCVWAAAKSDR
jgi:bacteriorhodopsin